MRYLVCDIIMSEVLHMILMKDIIREGHKTLETVAKEVKLPLTKADKKLLIDLMEYVKNSQDDEAL